VEAVIRHVAQTHGRLDLLVNNAWGAHDGQGAGGNSVGAGGEVWDEPLPPLRGMLLAGAYSDYVTILLALRHVMAAQGRGLIVSTTWHTDEPPGWLPYEVSKAAKNRLVYALGHQLREKGIAVVGVAPGWMRTEVMFLHHTPGELQGQTETPHYAARGIVALACDPAVMRHSGKILDVGELADLYGFTDLDGTQPQWYATQRKARA
jgi:NAD(P)-dependent dehydrogenase (short-subunit alcohol dehydrogenase family)